MSVILDGSMIQVTPHMRILVAIEPIDFRAGIDGLVQACRTRLQSAPFMLAVVFNPHKSGCRKWVRDLAAECDGQLWS